MPVVLHTAGVLALHGVIRSAWHFLGKEGGAMLRIRIASLFFIVAAPLLLNGQECLHGSDEPVAEKERRTAALNAVRLINTAQQYHKTKFRKYVSWPELAASPVLQEMRQHGQFAKTLARVSLDPAQPVLP
ncbi:MAG: hypothetical protein ACRDFW_10375, partial [bacterium]